MNYLDGADHHVHDATIDGSGIKYKGHVPMSYFDLRRAHQNDETKQRAEYTRAFHLSC